MIRVRALALLTLAIAAAVAAPAHAELPRAVGRAFLDNGIPLNRVAIVVQQVGKPRPLFTLDPDRPMNPASVMKLVTTFAALEILGRDYRWKTEAYLAGKLNRGTLKGDLILKGYGDPKITVERWQAFMATLRAAGLDRIDGDLALDRSYFALPEHDPALFDGEPLKPYNVGPDALLVNFKSVRFVFAPDAAGSIGENRSRAAVARCRPRAAAGALGSRMRRLARRARRELRKPARASGGVVRRAVRRELRRARVVGGAARPSALRSRDLHRNVSRSRWTIHGGIEGTPCAARRRAVRDAGIAPALRRGARRQQAVEQRHGAADFPDARRQRWRDPGHARESRRNGEALSGVAGACRARTRDGERVGPVAQRAHQRARPRRGFCLPPMQAAYATNSPRRSPWRRWTAPCSGASRRAPSPVRRC